MFWKKFKLWYEFARRRPWVTLLQYSAFVAMLLGIKLWLISSYGNATPFWDQWDAEAARLYKPFLEGTLGWTDLFAAHNEHRIFMTRVLVLALLTINGIWNPLLQMVVNAVLHITALGLGIVLLTRVIGRNRLSALLFFSIVLFGIPYGWENTLLGLQSNFYFVLLFSIASLWLTVTQHPLSARWWGGVACGMLAFLSLASGIFALAAAAVVGVALYAMGLRKTHYQLAAVAILTGLFMLGVALTPTVADHASLKAASFPQFLNALTTILGWPVAELARGLVIMQLTSPLIRNIPALIFVGFMLWKRPPANNRKWFLLALVVWMLGQAVSIAYGRAVGILLSSRYLDFFAVDILVNFACLIAIAQDHITMRHGWAITGVGAWTIVVLISLGLYAGRHIPVDLAWKRNTGFAQETNTRNYLSTDDFNYLAGKPFFDVPYPDPERLASILSSPTIRAILPTNIRPPLAYTSFESNPADTFVANGCYPTTPKRTGVALGSYGTQGNAATGQATIRFDANKQSALVAIPVAGYPLSDGIKLEIEQNGQRTPIVMKSNPGKSWGVAYVKAGSGAFFIHLTDGSTTNWLAVGTPSVVGRLDVLTKALLAMYPVFMMLGLVAEALSVWQCGPKSRVAESVED